MEQRDWLVNAKMYRYFGFMLTTLFKRVMFLVPIVIIINEEDIRWRLSRLVLLRRYREVAM